MSGGLVRSLHGVTLRLTGVTGAAPRVNSTRVLCACQPTRTCVQQAAQSTQVSYIRIPPRIHSFWPPDSTMFTCHCCLLACFSFFLSLSLHLPHSLSSLSCTFAPAHWHGQRLRQSSHPSKHIQEHKNRQTDTPHTPLATSSMDSTILPVGQRISFFVTTATVQVQYNTARLGPMYRVPTGKTWKFERPLPFRETSGKMTFLAKLKRKKVVSVNGSFLTQKSKQILFLGWKTCCCIFCTKMNNFVAWNGNFSVDFCPKWCGTWMEENSGTEVGTLCVCAQGTYPQHRVPIRYWLSTNPILSCNLGPNDVNAKLPILDTTTAILINKEERHTYLLLLSISDQFITPFFFSYLCQIVDHSSFWIFCCWCWIDILFPKIFSPWSIR